MSAYLMTVTMLSTRNLMIMRSLSLDQDVFEPHTHPRQPQPGPHAQLLDTIDAITARMPPGIAPTFKFVFNLQTSATAFQTLPPVTSNVVSASSTGHRPSSCTTSAGQTKPRKTTLKQPRRVRNLEKLVAETAAKTAAEQTGPSRYRTTRHSVAGPKSDY